MPLPPWFLLCGLVFLVFLAFLLGWLGSRWWLLRRGLYVPWERVTPEEARREMRAWVPAFRAEGARAHPAETGWEIHLTLRQAQPLPRPGVRLPRWAVFQKMRHRLVRLPREALLWAGVLTFLLALRFVGLYRFPLSFHADEANQTLLAEALVQNGFRGDRGELFPTFFRNVYFYNLSVSVYLQVLPYLLLGKRIWVTRGVSILVGLGVPLFTGLYVKHGWKKPFWLGALVASGLPVWFLHSRTAFETVEATAFFAATVYAYMRYLQGRTRWLYAAVLAAGLTFYTYAAARAVVLTFALLAAVLDFPHHRRHRPASLKALALAGVLSLPLLRFLHLYPEALSEHLRMLGSYIADPALSPSEKALRFVREYAYAVSPWTWFRPYPPMLIRHVLPPFGHLFWAALPFWLGGLAVTLRRWRDAAARPLLWAWLAMPMGSALYEFGVTRSLTAVVPAAVWVTLGLEEAARFLAWRPAWMPHLRHGLAGGLVAGHLLLLGYGLYAYPRATDDYGLYGFQYGSPQLFWAMKAWLHEGRARSIFYSPTWANSVDVLAAYFLTPEEREHIRAAGPERLAQGELPEGPEVWYVLSAGDFPTFEQRIRPKLREVHPTASLPYPNGQVGFQAFWYRYRPDLAQILEAERRALLAPKTTTLPLLGMPVRVTYPPLDMGRIENIVDGHPWTLVRTARANPLRLRFRFPDPVLLQGLELLKGKSPVAVAVQVHTAEDDTWAMEIRPEPHQEWVALSFPRPMQVVELELRVQDLSWPEDEGHVHLWEVRFLAP